MAMTLSLPYNPFYPFIIMDLPLNPSLKMVKLFVSQFSKQLKEQNTTVLIIKDSIKIIPGALGKLAKEFQVNTLKGHFPHYFFLDNIR